VYNALYVYIAPGEEFKYTESSEGQVKAKSALKSAVTSNNSPSKIKHEAQKPKAHDLSSIGQRPKLQENSVVDATRIKMPFSGPTLRMQRSNNWSKQVLLASPVLVPPPCSGRGASVPQ